MPPEDSEDQPDTGDDNTDQPETGNTIAALQAEVEKWKKLARKHEGRANSALTQLDKLKTDTDGANRSDMEKLQTTVEQLSSDLADERRKTMITEIASERGLSPAQAKRLKGTTREELEADADEIVEAFGIKPKSAKDNDTEPDKGDKGEDAKDDAPDDGKEQQGKPDEGAKPTSTGKPKEKLRSGAAPDDDAEPNVDDLADKIIKRRVI